MRTRLGTVLDTALDNLWRTATGRRVLESVAPGVYRRLEALRLLGTSTTHPPTPDPHRDRALAARLCPDMRVHRGPCEGLTYPSTEAHGSVLLPKLLGCYECELHPMLEHLLGRQPSGIVDVGCAEGYYAVGLARRCPGAHCYAFDTDPRARSLCTRMAAFNDVLARLTVGEACTPATLAALPLGASGLILVDCEGCELGLLDDSMPAVLRSHSLIVECHDFVKPGVTQALTSRFSSTHHVMTVATLGDFERAQVIALPEFADLTAEERLAAVAERRPTRMHWLVMLPRNR